VRIRHSVVETLQLNETNLHRGIQSAQYAAVQAPRKTSFETTRGEHPSPAISLYDRDMQIVVTDNRPASPRSRSQSTVNSRRLIRGRMSNSIVTIAILVPIKHWIRSAP